MGALNTVVPHESMLHVFPKRTVGSASEKLEKLEVRKENSMVHEECDDACRAAAAGDWAQV